MGTEKYFIQLFPRVLSVRVAAGIIYRVLSDGREKIITITMC